MFSIKSIKRQTVKNNLWYYLLLALPLICYFVIFFKPVVEGLLLSFYKWDGLSVQKTFVGFQNYVRIFTIDTSFWPAFKNTLIYMLFVVLIGGSLGLLVAVLIYRKHFVNNIFRTVFYMPGVLSTIAVAFMWSNAIYNPNFGLLNDFLHAVNLDSLARVWLGEKSLIIFSVAAVQVYMDFGMNMVLFIAGLQDIPEEMYESARIEGANPFQSFAYITVPLLKGTISLVFILAMISSVRSFDLMYLLAENTDVLATYLFKEMFANGRVGTGSATAIVLLALVLFFTILQGYLTRDKD